MTEPAAYQAPDLDLVQEAHVQKYRETGGAVGHIWNGVSCLLLTSIGRRTGIERTTALIYCRDRDDYIVVASLGGAPRHPQWYLNLSANPTVQLQVLDQQITAAASTAEGPERDRLWKLAAAQWPNYDTYATRTTRQIPVVVLRPQT